MTKPTDPTKREERVTALAEKIVAKNEVSEAYRKHGCGGNAELIDEDVALFEELQYLRQQAAPPSKALTDALVEACKMVQDEKIDWVPGATSLTISAKSYNFLCSALALFDDLPAPPSKAQGPYEATRCSDYSRHPIIVKNGDIVDLKTVCDLLNANTEPVEGLQELAKAEIVKGQNEILNKAIKKALLSIKDLQQILTALGVSFD